MLFVLPLLALVATAFAKDASPDANPADVPVGVGVGAPDPVFGEGVEVDPNLTFVWEDALWVGVLLSSSIVVADVDCSVLSGEIPENEYIGFPFVVRDCLKGTLPDTNLVLRVWPRWEENVEALRNCAPSNSATGPALLFLDGPFREVDGYVTARWYRRGIGPAEEKTIADVKREVDAQRRALESFDRLVVPESLPHWASVSNAVAELTVDADHENRAIETILSLGVDAVPALIVLMDDRRELPVQRVALVNPPDHWEAYRQYGPKTVVDLADALADHSLGLGFASIMNGGTERDRRKAVEQWRLLLIRWLQENRKAGKFLRPVLVGK